MAPVRFDRVASRPLSLWQSAVAENARRQLEKTQGNVSSTMIMQHPMVCAAADHVTATFAGSPPSAERNLAVPHQLNVYLSHICYEKAKAQFSGDAALADYWDATYRPFSDKDPGFLTCESTFLYYWELYNGVACYNDWTIQGNNNLNYGVIEYQLPSNAVVAVIGDWGTGMDDAISLVSHIISTFNPTAIIHLGDIYYSGTPGECTQYFVQALQQAGADNIPVFTLPGNHDYYAWGYGFFPMLQQLNKKIPGAAQEASYFCLRTEDGGYQFLGMDTGFNDANPMDQVNASYAGPWLQPTEITWHQDKLNNFNGATILLSHHQLYTTNQKINGNLSQYGNLPYLNPYLYQVFWPYLSTKIAAWLWGHEHNFALFQQNLLQVQNPILLGCSAYEELTSANPYVQTYPQIPYRNAESNWQLGTNTDPGGIGYYNHAFAVIDFSVRKNPSDPVEVSYLQYPSWGAVKPSNPASSTLVGSYIFPLTPPAPVPVQYRAPVNLFCMEGLFISSLYYLAPYNYPTATTNQPAVLEINSSSKSGTINHGDIVSIQTTESAAGSNNLLGAWSTPTLYYYSGNYTQLQWTIYKKDTSNGTQINYGDLVYFVNQYYNQWMMPYWSKVYSSIYLTTQANIQYYWQFLQPS